MEIAIWAFDWRDVHIFPGDRSLWWMAEMGEVRAVEGWQMSVLPLKKAAGLVFGSFDNGEKQAC